MSLLLLSLTVFALTVASGLAWPYLKQPLRAATAATLPNARMLETAGFERPAADRRGDDGAVRVARVIDGDTLDLVGGERVRILNIDTAEMPPKAQCAEEAELAVAAKRRLEALVRQGGEITLGRIDRDRDPYGRLLRRVRIDGQDVGDQLVQEGLAQRWRGHKAQWC